MTQRRILVVDDEKNIRLMLSHALASETTTVETAINGEEALQKLQRADYDIVLLDLRMPGMDGLEALRRLRERSPDLPVILLTAHGTVESAVEAMRGGAVNFLQKPFSPREIREAVADALRAPSPSPDEDKLREDELREDAPREDGPDAPGSAGAGPPEDATS